MVGATWNGCRPGARSVYSIQPCISLQCHFIPSHIRKEHVFLAVPCPLHLYQNDRDLSRASLVTRGWNGYRNKNQHRILNLEKKILPPVLPGLEPTTFRSRVRRFMAGPSPFTHRTWIKQYSIHFTKRDHGPRLSTVLCSVQFKMVSVPSEKPICAPYNHADVSPTLPSERSQCSSDWRWPFLVLSRKIV